MKTGKPYRKFQVQQKKIEELEKNSERFRRVFSEYEEMEEELYNLENSDTSSIPDDFLSAIRLQKSYLEDEIDDWLLEENF